MHLPIRRILCHLLAAVKLHRLLDLRGNIPTFIHISGGRLQEVDVLDSMLGHY